MNETTTREWLRLPDPGEPIAVPPAAEPTPDGGTTLLDTAATIPTPFWVGLAALAILTTVIAATAVVIAVKRRPNAPRGGSVDKLMTFFGAAVATGVVGTGMWAFFRDTLHIDNVGLRIALFAFFEIAMLAEALRSRRFRLDRAAAHHAATADPDGDVQAVDVDGVAVWILALLSGGLAASHETEPGAVALRLIAPVVAAWLWERGLAGELRQFTRRRTGRPNPLRVLWERMLVSVGLAEPSGMTMGQRAQARHLNRLARARFRVHAYEAARANRLALGWARFMLRRRFIAAVNQLDLAGDATLRANLQERIAVLMEAEKGTGPDAVAHLKPWAPPAATRPTRESESSRLVIDSTATPTPGGTDSTASRTAVTSNPNPTRRVASTAHRTATAIAATPSAFEPARIGGDESEMVAAIRPFVAEFKGRRGKAPGQQTTRDELARLGFRVGTRRAGELAELADLANESQAAASDSGQPTDRIDVADSDSPESDSDSGERSA